MFGSKQARILRLVALLQEERARNDELRATLRIASRSLSEALDATQRLQGDLARVNADHPASDTLQPESI